MSESFLDNQQITASDLNNIAIDLGKSTFADFADGTVYNVDSLNGITKSLVYPGVVCGDGNQFQVTKVQDGKIKVDTGLSIFASGAKKRLTQAEYIDVSVGMKQFIYLLNDTALNKIYITVAATDPGIVLEEDADYVMLAWYNEDDTLTDRRTFSKAKVDIPSANTYLSKTFSDTLGPNITPPTYLLHTVTATKPFKYVWSDDYSYTDLAELAEGKKVGVRVATNHVILVEKNGLQFNIYSDNTNSGAGGVTYTLHFV